MKKIAVLGLIITMLLGLCGCTVLNNPKSNIKEGRFETIYHSVNIKNVSILVDKETKSSILIRYLVAFCVASFLFLSVLKENFSLHFGQTQRTFSKPSAISFDL